MAPVDPTIKPRKTGRPRRGEAPVIPWNEVDRLLVFGETVKDPRNGQEGIRYPSLADLGERCSVSRNMMWRYANKHKCFARREEARRKTIESYEHKVIEKTATTRADATTEVSQIVDRYVVDFHQALRDGKVQANSALDLDRLVRLKELLTGNADTRSEVNGQISLEAIQGRHRRMRDQGDGTAAEAAGVVGHGHTFEAAAVEEAEQRERQVRAGLEAIAPELGGTAVPDEAKPATTAPELGGVVQDELKGDAAQEGANGEAE